MKELRARLKEIESKVDRLIIEINRLESCLLPTGIRYDLDKVQTSPDDLMASVMAEVGDKIAEVRSLQTEKLNLIKEMHDRIEAVEDDRGKLILTEYFIGGRSLREIGRRMHYSKSQIDRLFQKNVSKLQEGTKGTKRDKS